MDPTHPSTQVPSAGKELSLLPSYQRLEPEWWMSDPSTTPGPCRWGQEPHFFSPHALDTHLLLINVCPRRAEERNEGGNLILLLKSVSTLGSGPNLTTFLYGWTRTKW